jgi:hypothetical protein
MGFLRKRKEPRARGARTGANAGAETAAEAATEAAPPAVREPVERQIGYNPERDEYLFWWTTDGYVIAQDVASQYEYVQETRCPDCGGSLRVVAHLNRSGQGLSELVAICAGCGQRANFIFDISNDVYQAWMARELGALYVQQYDGPPREPHAP